MSDHKLSEDERCLQELKRLRDHETKNKRVKQTLGAEILTCERRMKYHDLLSEKKQVFEKLQSLEELLEVTSSTVLHEDLNQLILPLKKEVQHLTDELVKPEMTKDEFKNRLIQCEEMLAMILFSLSDGNESEKETTKPAKTGNESPWLMLCQAEASLNAHQSGLPTTAITKYAFIESDEYVKIYVDMPGLRESDKNKLKPTLSERHFSLLVADVGGKNYKISFTNFTEVVDVENSKIRAKKDWVEVLLKKKRPITWGNLTSAIGSDAFFARLISDTKIKFNEQDIMCRELVNFTSDDQRRIIMAKQGFYSVKDAPSGKMTLAMISEFPPKICDFIWKDKSPGAEKILDEVIRAVAKSDCYVTWFNTGSEWEKSKHQFDDKYIEQIISGKCTLVQFFGRLKSECWSLMPATALEVTAIITCSDDISALTSCTTVFELFHLCIARLLPLSELKPVYAATSEQPISLSVTDMTDDDVEWLLKAVDVLVPLMTLPNLQQVRHAFQIALIACRMTVVGHRALCHRLPPEVFRVKVFDYTNSPHIEALVQTYAMRNCSFIYCDEFSTHAYKTL